MKKRVNKPLNKKGQDLSIGTLILIVLGIVVLVLLVLGFSLGWQNLWEKINIFGGTSSIGDTVTACRLAHTSQDTYTLCEKKWSIKNSTGDKEDISCAILKDRGLLDITFSCPTSSQDNCIPKPGECSDLSDPTAQTCGGACLYTPAEGETAATCTIAANAAETCSAQNENDNVCDALLGCQPRE